MEQNRQTGRTTRMLLKIASEALEPGIKVIFVVAHDYRYAHHLQDRLAKLFYGLDLDEMRLTRGFLIQIHDSYIMFGIDIPTMVQASRGIHARPIVFCDHYFLELRRPVRPKPPETGTTSDVKRAPSVFAGTKFSGYLRELGIDTKKMLTKLRNLL